MLLACAIPAGNARAWGEEGHRMVGNIAARYLTPEAARQVAVLLRDDRLADKEPSGRKTLGEIAYWADEIKDYPRGKRLGRWHFDNIPLCGEADYARYCPGGACASAQLARHVEMLTNRRVPIYRKNGLDTFAPDLKPTQVVTNRFIDPAIDLRTRKCP